MKLSVWWKVLSLGLGLLLLVLAFYGARNAFRRESREREVRREFGVDTSARGLNVFVVITDVDPIKATAQARVVCNPQGSLSDDDGNPTVNLKLYANNLGDQDHYFKAGESMAPFEMSMNLFDGSAADYPFDHFTTELEFQTSVAMPGHSRRGIQLIPTRIFVSSNASGIKLTPGETNVSTPGYVRIDFSVERSGTTVATAVFGMAVMWALGLSVLTLTLNIIITHEHLNTLTFFSGLLFALFSFRNSLPGTPPVGTLSDFVSFFWVEAIVSISLVIVVALNIPRRQKPAATEPAPEPEIIETTA